MLFGGRKTRKHGRKHTKGTRSATRPGRKDYMTHKGDRDYHRRGHDVRGHPFSRHRRRGGTVHRRHRFRKGTRSRTRVGDLDFSTKLGDLVFHRKRHDVRRKRKPFTTRRRHKHRRHRRRR